MADSIQLGSVRVAFVADVATGIASIGRFGKSIDSAVSAARAATAKLSESISTINTAAGTLSLGAALRSFGQYEDQLSNIRAVGKQSAAEFAATEEKLFRLSQSVGVSSTETLKAYNDIVQAGYDVAQAQDVVSASLRGAQAGATDAATANLALIQTLQAFDLPTERAGDVMGKLIKAVDLGVFSFPKLAANIGTFASIAKTAGLSLEDALGGVTAATRKEANLDEVATQLKATLSDLVGAAPKVRAELEGILGTTVEAALRGRGFAEVLREITQATGGSATALTRLFPNIRAFNFVSKFAGDGIQSLTKDINELRSTGEETLNQTRRIQLESFGAAGRVIAAEIQNSIISVFRKNREAIQSLTFATKDFIANNRETLASLTAVAIALGGVGAAGLALKVVLSGVSALFGLVGGGVKALIAIGTAAKAVGAAFAWLNIVPGGLSVIATAAGVLAAKFLAVAAAIAAVGAVGYKAGKEISEATAPITGSDTNADNKEREALEFQFDQQNRLAKSRQQYHEEERKAVAELKKQLDDAAQSVAKGSLDATKKVLELRKAIEDKTHENVLEGLTARYDKLREEIALAVQEQRRLGVALGTMKKPGVGGEFIDPARILAGVNGNTSEKASEKADEYESLRLQIEGLRRAASSATNDTQILEKQLKNLEVSAASAGKVFGEIANDPALEKLEERINKEAKTPAGEQIREDVDEIKKRSEELQVLLGNIQRQRKQLLDDKTRAFNPEDPNNGTRQDDAGRLVAALQEQEDRLTKLIEVNEGIRTRVREQEEKRRLDATRDALDEEAELEIEALKKSGKLREADDRESELRHQQRLRKIEELAEVDEATKDRLRKAAEKVHQEEIRDIEEAEKKRYESTEEGRLLQKKADEEKEKARKLAEAGQVRLQILQAQANGDIREELRLRERLVELLRDAGDEQARTLEVDKQSVKAARERLELLRQEIEDKINAGTGNAGDTTRAIQRTISELVGSSDLDSFRGSARDRLSKFGDEGEARQFVNTISTALEAEYKSLERERIEALKKGDLEGAKKIQDQQRETIQKYRVLLQELQRAIREIRLDRQIDTRNARTKSETETALTGADPPAERPPGTAPVTNPQKTVSPPSATQPAPAQVGPPVPVTIAPEPGKPSPKTPGGLPDKVESPGVLFDELIRKIGGDENRSTDVTSILGPEINETINRLLNTDQGPLADGKAAGGVAIADVAASLQDALQSLAITTGSAKDSLDGAFTATQDAIREINGKMEQVIEVANRHTEAMRTEQRRTQDSTLDTAP